MKKIFSMILIMALMLGTSLADVGAASQKAINVFVDGTYAPGNVARPFLEDGRTLVPVRPVAETMRAEIFWDDATQTVTLRKQNNKITHEGTEYLNCFTSAGLVIGQKIITIGLTDASGAVVFSVQREMDVAAKTIDGRTYIPARYIGYALGYDVSWEDKPDMASRVIYKYTGKQTLDFSGDSTNPVYDPVKRIDYEYDKEKYPEKIVVNDIEYPCRKGYGDIVIVDATRGRFEGTKMINVFPYRWTGSNVIIECEDERYKIDASQSIDENLEAYYRFYTEKVGEKIIVEDKTYYPELSTYENVGIFRALPDGGGYSVINAYPEVDSTKMYFIDERPYEGYYPGTSTYGKKLSGLLSTAYDKNTLMFLNSFLGETGQRIWTMMHEYYTMSGHSYVAPDTEWTKKHFFVDENNHVSFYLPDKLDRIPTEVVEKYGFTVLENDKVSETSEYLLKIKTEKQIIDIRYVSDNLLAGPMSGYFVYFTTLEN